MSSDVFTPLFVTGCYRSGTTLVEKLLHANPAVTVASQPFPLLYIRVKEAFNAAIGIERRYPLDHLFLEDGYSGEELCQFLDRFVLSAAELARLFSDLEAYTEGLWTPEILGFRDQIVPGTFHQVFTQLLGCVARLFPKPGLRLVGAKEVLCEEYVPYLLARGGRAVIVLRDPRDMIRSLNFGDRDNRTGLARPILYSLRAWRKSVALACACEGRPGFAWLRYEDLVASPERELARLVRLLDLDPVAAAPAGDIRDQRGRPWRGNSSFDDKQGVSSSSLGRFRDRLVPAVLAYIETACLPEMRVAGYQPVSVSGFDEAALTGFREPSDRIHVKFSPDYGSDPGRIRDEVERQRVLGAPAPLSPAEARRWFIHERAYERLRAAALAGPAP